MQTLRSHCPLDDRRERYLRAALDEIPGDNRQRKFPKEGNRQMLRKCVQVLQDHRDEEPSRAAPKQKIVKVTSEELSEIFSGEKAIPELGVSLKELLVGDDCDGYSSKSKFSVTPRLEIKPLMVRSKWAYFNFFRFFDKMKRIVNRCAV